MPEIEQYKNLVLGSGEAGKYTAWALAKAGERTAVVERGLIGGSCPNIACLPSKNAVQFQCFDVRKRPCFKDSWDAGNRSVSANVQENSITG